MVSAVFDHIFAILIVGAIFVSTIVVMPTMTLGNFQAVDEQQLRNTALNVFNTMLLDTGNPVDWGALSNFQPDDPRVQRFGLAKAQEPSFYILDPDKVQKLVPGNPLNSLSYSKTRQLLGLQNYGFRLRIIPPFNVTFLDTSVNGYNLTFRVRVTYLAGDPVPKAQTSATAVYTKGDTIFGVAKSNVFETNAMGICDGYVILGTDNPDYYMVTIRATVADVATLIVNSGQVFNNTIAKINLQYDTLILTTTKDPPNYNQPPNDQAWIKNIVAFDNMGNIWNLYNGTKDDKFNTGDGSYELWAKDFCGLHGFEPVVLIFNFWVVDQVTGHGRQFVLVMLAYPDLFGTNIFEYGGSPSSGTQVVRLQRSVIITSMTYTAELWLWKEQ